MKGKARSVKLPGMIVVTTLAMLLILASTSFPQDDATYTRQSVMRYQKRYGLTGHQLDALLPSVELETNNLAKIYSKYNAMEDFDSPAFWEQIDIWQDMTRARQMVWQNAPEHLSRPQAQALNSMCSKLEKETLLVLLDEQLFDWGEQLDLTNEQFKEIELTIRRDISRNQFLIDRSRNASDSAIVKMETVVDDLQRQIQRILFPEQRNVYQKNKLKQKMGSKLWA
jgi:hypothetical protein